MNTVARHFTPAKGGAVHTMLGDGNMLQAREQSLNP